MIDDLSSNSTSIVLLLFVGMRLFKFSTPKWFIIFKFILICLMGNHGDEMRCVLASAFETETGLIGSDGFSNLNEGNRLFRLLKYDQAVEHYWRAILEYEKQSSPQQQGSKKLYRLEDAYNGFMKCFAVRGQIVEGFLFIARESIARNQMDLAKLYLQQAIDADPNNDEALEIKRRIRKHEERLKSQPVHSSTSSENIEKAKKLYSVGLDYFKDKSFYLAAEAFEESCTLAAGSVVLNSACTNAVYCRANILEWGANATQYRNDMERINHITNEEVALFRNIDKDKRVKWKRATSVSPHMALGYEIDSILKRHISESHASIDEIIARYDSDTRVLKELPKGLPYDVNSGRQKFQQDEKSDSFKIRVGFVSAAFCSKAILYLSHDMFRFFDKDAFEIHIFSLGPPDSPFFIHEAMRGVDWRERVKSSVDYFHDLQKIKSDHIALARMIHSMDIHILIEWDGYARQGDRAQGLFALRPSPVQILHQEFLGTYGADYVDYIVTDRHTSPEIASDYHTEQFIYLPNHFFSKGHAVQDEVAAPSFDYVPKQMPYLLGTGTPQENRCLLPTDIGPKKVSFVYCNFNKFIKNNPETLISWIKILQQVPDSILCLLENPKSGVRNLRNFIHDIATSSGIDGDKLNQRIRFLPWENNPFDHQIRNRDFCNVVLDNHPYNGHTTAQDGKCKRFKNHFTVEYFILSLAQRFMRGFQ